MASNLVPTFTVAEIIQADLPDASLDILIDEAEAMIERVVGDVDDATRTYRTNVWPPTPYLSLPHEIESVTSVTMGRRHGRRRRLRDRGHRRDPPT